MQVKVIINDTWSSAWHLRHARSLRFRGQFLYSRSEHDGNGEAARGVTHFIGHHLIALTSRITTRPQRLTGQRSAVARHQRM